MIKDQVIRNETEMEDTGKTCINISDSCHHGLTPERQLCCFHPYFCFAFIDKVNEKLMLVQKRKIEVN